MIKSWTSKGDGPPLFRRQAAACVSAHRCYPVLEDERIATLKAALGLEGEEIDDKLGSS